MALTCLTVDLDVLYAKNTSRDLTIAWGFLWLTGYRSASLDSGLMTTVRYAMGIIGCLAVIAAVTGSALPVKQPNARCRSAAVMVPSLV